MNSNAPGNPASAPDEELIDFLEDGTDAPALPSHLPSWKILIVDDEADVHQATLLALRDIQVLGRELEFLHAYSASEAKALIIQNEDLALILLDVVMESSNAGLELVRVIREELRREAVRIILRTGQPGYAPEIDTISAYDINDYKTKQELTRVRLYTSLTVGLRSYQQIQTLEQSRQGLHLIVTGSAELSKLRGLQRFAQGVVLQLSSFLGIEPDGLICAQGTLSEGEVPRVIAAAGHFSHLIHVPLDELDSPTVRESLIRCLKEKDHQLGDPCCLYFSTSTGRGMAAFINCPRPLAPVDRNLLEVFCSSISVGMENVLLYSQLLDFAFNDQLVRLPNRLRFVELIDQHLAQAEQGTLALVDIDDFAGINNALGHRFGDRVLQAVSQRLGDLVSGKAVLARVSGDTFGVLGPDAVVNPQVLGQAFAAPYEIGDENLRLSASFGLVRLSTNSSGGAELLKDGQLALKQAKYRHRGGAEYFTDNMGVVARERLRLLGGLRSAFEDRRLFVAYQPQVMLDGEQVIGAEALVRWRTDNGDFVAPDLFIPLAEHSGLIVAIGEFVLRTALHQLHRLHSQGWTDFRMSVNVSHIQLREPGFVNLLQKAIADTRVSPTNVELEITESAAMEDVEFMMMVLAELRATGVSVAIDDFGTGYSSLSVLRQLQVQRLKIDKSFVQQIEQDAEQGAIARMVIDLAQCLKLDVIAEGVESAEQKARLIALGCPSGQGYLFARPMTAEQLETWLSKPGQQP